MSITKSFTFSMEKEHDPAKNGMTLIRGRVYRDEDGNLFIRKQEWIVPRHHRTGRPMKSVEYVGIPTDFTAEDLEIILDAMKSTA